MSAQCPVCCQDMYNDEILCDKCEKPVGSNNFAVVGGPGGTFVYHIGCYDEVYWGDELRDGPDFCPACAGLHGLHNCGQNNGQNMRQEADDVGGEPSHNDNPDPTYQDCWPSERYPSDGGTYLTMGPVE